jgi:hypothetical protein
LAVESSAVRASNEGPAKVKTVERVLSNSISTGVDKAPREVTSGLFHSKEDLNFVPRGEIINRGTVGSRSSTAYCPGPFISCMRSCIVVAEASCVGNEQAIPGGRRCWGVSVVHGFSS